MTVPMVPSHMGCQLTVAMVPYHMYLHLTVAMLPYHMYLHLAVAMVLMVPKVHRSFFSNLDLQSGSWSMSANIYIIMQ